MAQDRIDELRERRDDLTAFERGELRALERRRRSAPEPTTRSEGYEAGRARARARFGRTEED